MSSNSENSFKQLQDEEEQQLPHPPPQVEQNIMGNARNIQFMGNVVELYVSRFFDLLVSWFGGDVSKNENQKKGTAANDADHTPKGNAK